jgi:hypothetical protein
MRIAESQLLAERQIENLKSLSSSFFGFRPFLGFLTLSVLHLPPCNFAVVGDSTKASDFRVAKFNTAPITFCKSARRQRNPEVNLDFAKASFLVAMKFDLGTSKVFPDEPVQTVH